MQPRGLPSEKSVQHAGQNIDQEALRTRLDTGGLAFARAGDIEDERHGMRGGKKLPEPFPYLSYSIRLAKRNDKMRPHQVDAEVPRPKRTAADRVSIDQD